MLWRSMKRPEMISLKDIICHRHYFAYPHICHKFPLLITTTLTSIRQNKQKKEFCSQLLSTPLSNTKTLFFIGLKLVEKRKDVIFFSYACSCEQVCVCVCVTVILNVIELRCWSARKINTNKNNKNNLYMCIIPM